MFTVGPVQENCFLFRRDGAEQALIVDPGEEPERLLSAIDGLGVSLEGILLTHTHFDHVGAVAPLARATGAEVWVPRIERPVLADIMSYVPWPGFGPFESYDAEHDLEGGERLSLAGFDIDVIFTPGHSPGHVSFSIPDERAIFSGDVLFQGSVGRVDLPGGHGPTLLASIRELVESLPEDTAVHPGHMGLTTLGAERATNPFLAEFHQGSPSGPR
jgi:glyoxylase-like metal-dependent hydrolase (beta-lactamase superfamily II)